MIKQFYSEKLKILKSYNIDNPELDLKLLIKGSVKKKYNFIHEISMSDIDTSIDFVAAGVTGKDPIDIYIDQKTMGSFASAGKAVF